MKISNFFAAVFTFIIMLSCVVHGQNVSAILVYDGKVHNYEAEEIKIMGTFDILRISSHQW